MVRNLKNTSVLVTGANGFIGSHLTRKLLNLGARVKIFVRPSKGISLWKIDDIKNKIEIFRVDIRDRQRIKKIIKKIKPLKIYHLAAYVHPVRSFELINEMIDINLKGTVNLLEALRESKFDCFINTGTSEEYGDNKGPYLETQRENPVSPYAASKVCSTNFCQMLWRTEKLRIVTVRLPLAYGPYQRSNFLIPTLIQKCLKNEVFEITKGEQTRDFIYVSDVVDGYIQTSITEKAVGEIINLGSGLECKVKDVANLIVKLTGSKRRHKVGLLPYRTCEIMHLYCSNEKAKILLKWQPRVDLETGLRKTIEWYKSYLSQNKKSIDKNLAAPYYSQKFKHIAIKIKNNE